LVSQNSKVVEVKTATKYQRQYSYAKGIAFDVAIDAVAVVMGVLTK
jgi:hypothetical protein